jgi:thiol-disulfide isomerase/thioredoxin
MLNNPLIKDINISEFKQRTTGLFTKTKKDGFIFVGAEWCGYCRKVAPEIDNLATSSGMRLPVFFVDGGKKENKLLLNLLKVVSFPTIFLVFENKLTVYNGDRNVQSFLAGMCNLSNKSLCFNT